MKKKLQDFLSNIKWDNAAIGGGAGILGGLLFNRFILGNKTWRSRAIASAIGAALGGGGSILYDQLNNGVLRGNSSGGKRDNNSKDLTEDRKTELENYKNTTALARDLTGSPTLNVVARSAVGGATGAAAGRLLDAGQQTILGARTKQPIVVPRPGSKTQPEVRVEYGKLGGRGTLNSSDIAKLTHREKEILLSQVNSGKYDVALTADQRINPALFGGIQRPSDVMKARKLAVMDARRSMSTLPDIETLESRVASSQKDLYDAQAYGKKLARVIKRAKNGRADTLKTVAQAEHKRRAALAKDLTRTMEDLREARKARAAVRRSTLDVLSRIKKPLANPWSTRNGVQHMLRRPWAGLLSTIGLVLGARDAVNAMEYRRELLDDMSKYDSKWK